MMYLKIAIRYTMHRFVNYVAILALAIALAVQIIAMSVLDGMLISLENRMQGLGEQITIDFLGNYQNKENIENIEKKIIKQIPEVIAVTPMYQDVGLLQGMGKADYAWIYGIDIENETKYGSLDKYLTSYKINKKNPKWFPENMKNTNRPPVFIGETLAESLNIKPGEEVELIYAEKQENGKLETKSLRLIVTSLFRTGSYQKDRYAVYMPLEEANKFYLSDIQEKPEEIIPTVVCWLKNPYQAKELAKKIEKIVQNNISQKVKVTNWQDRWSTIAEGMKHENNLMELVLILNDFASGFCVFAIMVTLVSRRTKDAGLLRCMGASRLGIISIFMMVGVIIGVLGVGIGVTSSLLVAGPLKIEKNQYGYALVAGGAVKNSFDINNKPEKLRPRLDIYYEKITGYPLYPPRMFGVDDPAGLPIVIYPVKLLLYILVAIMVALIAAAYPALLAGCQEPVTALRKE